MRTEEELYKATVRTDMLWVFLRNAAVTGVRNAPQQTAHCRGIIRARKTLL